MLVRKAESYKSMPPQDTNAGSDKHRRAPIVAESHPWSGTRYIYPSREPGLSRSKSGRDSRTRNDEEALGKMCTMLESALVLIPWWALILGIADFGVRQLPAERSPARLEEGYATP